MEPFCGMSDNNINISDVIEVIQTTDPGFVDQDHGSSSVNMLSGGGVECIRPVPISTGSISPYVEILEQPASKALRFRYECEGRSAGSIPGVNSTAENKTFPSIRIVGYKGRAVVVVSCVTEDQPYRPHPHNLVGKEGCKKGVCTVEVATENMTVTFANLGIQCVKKKDIDLALKIREEMRVDPFRTGFDHIKTKIDLNAVRLCFQVFLEGTEKGKFNVPLPAVVSDPIYDKKAMSDLVICKLSHCSASVAGGLEMILLCEKVPKEEIKVKFFEERDGQIVWEAYADFQPSQVHKQVAIAFRTPSYRTQQIEEPVPVFIQLQRHDGVTSEALRFEMLPLGSDDPDSLRRKRQKFSNSSNALTCLVRHVQADAVQHGELFDQSIPYNFNLVKPEPMDNALSPYGGCMTAGPSALYPVGNSDSFSPLAAHNQRPRLSPKRTPSPMDCMDYRNPSMQPQQQNLQIPYLGSPNPQQILQPSGASEISHQITFDQPQAPNVLDRVNDQTGLGLGPLPNADDNVLDLDNQQYSFDLSLNQLNSADLAIFGTDLSENLSSGLSISDPVEGPGGNNGESTNSMSDSVTRLTTSTLQRICALNSMYKPPRDS